MHNIGTVFSKIVFTPEEALRLPITDNTVLIIFANMILSVSIIPAYN